MKTKTDLPRCPRCRVIGRPQGTSGYYGCPRCGGLFDGEPDEGGDYHDRDVSRRLEREERRRERSRRYHHRP